MNTPKPDRHTPPARTSRWSALLLALAATLAVPAARAVVGGAVPETAWVPTKTMAHDTRGAMHVAALRAGVPVRVAVSLQLRDRAALDALTADLAHGRTTHHLTSDEFLARHAPTQAQVQAVVAHLASSGFTNIEVAGNRLVVTAQGDAASVRAAFRADLHEYDVDGRRAYANVTAAQVPSHLSGTVLAVTGLQNVHRAHVTLKTPPPQGPGMVPQSISPITQTLFPSLYGAASMPVASGATIGVVTAGSMTQVVADLKAHAALVGWPVPPVTVIAVGQTGTDTSGQAEWDMDSQVALAAAGGTVRSMILYTATSFDDGDLMATFNRVVSDNKARAINVSLGECETDARDSGVLAADDQIFQAAVAQGQTFSVSSGDSGAYECGVSSTAQSYPGVSPYVMSIGGTRLGHNSTTYQGETAWSCTSASDCQQSASGGTGGGPSLVENAPSWQVSSGVLGASTKRGVPDIAFDGDPSSGALVYVSGSYQTIGGTSLAAPLFAGFWARIQSAHGNALPFPASTLYAGAATHATWFHDVTSGNNGFYSAATGWDNTTGYGSLQVGNFSTAFGTLPVANFSVRTSQLMAITTDLSGLSTGTITAHDWNFGDGGSHSTSVSPSHTYAAAGTYNITLKVTDSLGHTSTKVTPVTVSSTVVARDLIGNGGFETGVGMPWSISWGVLCTSSACAPEASHAGTGFLWFGGQGVAHTDWAEQTVTIPAGTTAATLAFYLKVESDDTGTVAHDLFRTQVVNPYGAVLKTFYAYSNLNRGSSYVLKSVDLTPWVGQTITVRFTGIENSSLVTSFLVDDVSLRIR
jgi:subtilase family serine protease